MLGFDSESPPKQKSTFKLSEDTVLNFPLYNYFSAFHEVANSEKTDYIHSWFCNMKNLYTTHNKLKCSYQDRQGLIL